MITGMGFIGTKTGGLYRMNGRRTVKKTASGNPITLTDSVENKPLNMKLYGWSKQDGTPSPENPVEIESAGGDRKIGVSVRGKNLFHITKESDCDKAYDNTTKRIILPGEYLISSNNYYIAHDAFIDFNTDNLSFVYSGKSGYGVGIGTNCQKNKTYAFSFETNKGAAYAIFYGEDGTHKTRVLVSTYNVFFIPDYVEHVVILLTNNDGAVAGDTIWFKNIQIEETKSVTAYEPYRTPQSTAIVTPNGLPGIPVPSNTAGITYTDANGQSWIADEIDLERGKYVQRVWQAEFDGSEKRWVLYKNVQYSGFAIKVLPHKKMMRRYGLCTQYKTENLTTSNEAIWIGVNDDVLYVKNSRFYDASLDDRGLSNFKAHLAANPLVVMTYLDTPIERDLTSAELAEYIQLYSYKPTTVVENDSDCWMDVTYRGKK